MIVMNKYVQTYHDVASDFSQDLRTVKIMTNEGYFQRSYSDPKEVSKIIGEPNYINFPHYDTIIDYGWAFDQAIYHDYSDYLSEKEREDIPVRSVDTVRFSYKFYWIDVGFGPLNECKRLGDFTKNGFQSENCEMLINSLRKIRMENFTNVSFTQMLDIFRSIKKLADQ